MPTQDTCIINKLGLHARAAAKFANTANRFSSTIEVSCGEKTINGKSIMSLMLLAASQGTAISLSTTGKDATEALEALLELIANKFDEGE
ncbi:MAG TPA: HPr family phosphocarrier protein [Cellvibrionaceae bacterium]